MRTSFSPDHFQDGQEIFLATIVSCHGRDFELFFNDEMGQYNKNINNNDETDE